MNLVVLIIGMNLPTYTPLSHIIFNQFQDLKNVKISLFGHRIPISPPTVNFIFILRHRFSLRGWPLLFRIIYFSDGSRRLLPGDYSQTKLARYLKISSYSSAISSRPFQTFRTSYCPCENGVPPGFFLPSMTVSIHHASSSRPLLALKPHDLLNSTLLHELYTVNLLNPH